MEVLDLIDRDVGIDHLVMSGQTDFQGDAVRGEHFLAVNRKKTGPDVYPVDPRAKRDIPILTGPQGPVEASLAIPEATLIFKDGDPAYSPDGCRNEQYTE